MGRSKIVRVDRLAGVGPGGATQYHKPWQVLVERSQAVMCPRTDTRLGLVQLVTTRVNLVLGGMIVVGRPHVPNEADVVDLLGQVWPPVGDGNPTLTVMGEPHLHGKDLGVHVTNVDLFSRRAAKPLPVQRGVHRVGKRCLGKRLARVLVQHRLGVKCLHLAVATGEKDPDDGLGPGRKMRFARRLGISPHDAIGGQHRPHCQPGEAQSAIGQEVSSLHWIVP